MMSPWSFGKFPSSQSFYKSFTQLALSLWVAAALTAQWWTEDKVKLSTAVSWCTGRERTKEKSNSYVFVSSRAATSVSTTMKVSFFSDKATRRPHIAD